MTALLPWIQHFNQNVTCLSAPATAGQRITKSSLTLSQFHRSIGERSEATNEHPYPSTSHLIKSEAWLLACHWLCFASSGDPVLCRTRY